MWKWCFGLKAAETLAFRRRSALHFAALGLKASLGAPPTLLAPIQHLLCPLLPSSRPWEHGAVATHSSSLPWTNQNWSTWSWA